MRGPIGWIIGAVIGAGIGAAIWAAIAYFTGYEVGYVAVLVGALAGLGANLLGQEEGVFPGVIAAIAAILAIAGGKFIAVDLGVDHALTELSADVTFGPDDAIAALADGIVEQRESAGQTVDWPEPEPYDEDSDDSSWADDYNIADGYPADIWKEASASYDRMPQGDRQQWIDFAQREYEQGMTEFSDAIKSEEFSNSFSLFDILWLVLAVGAAFQLGSSGLGDDE